MGSATDNFGAMYVDGQVQRNWFKDCLLNTAVVACPRFLERPSRFLETPNRSTFTTFFVKQEAVGEHAKM